MDNGIKSIKSKQQTSQKIFQKLRFPNFQPSQNLKVPDTFYKIQSLHTHTQAQA